MPIQGTPVALEPSDTFVTAAHAVSVSGSVDLDEDGVDVTVDPDALIAISYLQDYLFQYHRVNAEGREFGLPNAYRIN